MRRDPNPTSVEPDPVDASAVRAIESASAKVGGVPVIYTSAFHRDEASTALLVAKSARSVMSLGVNVLAAAIRAKSTQLSSGIPKSGWIIATNHHVCVYSRAVGGGIGKKKGDIPIELIRSVKVDHLKNGKKSVFLEFHDESMVTIVLTTKATSPACSDWLRSLSGEPPTGSLARQARKNAKFDSELLFAQSSISGH